MAIGSLHDGTKALQDSEFIPAAINDDGITSATNGNSVAVTADIDVSYAGIVVGPAVSAPGLIVDAASATSQDGSPIGLIMLRQDNAAHQQVTVTPRDDTSDQLGAAALRVVSAGGMPTPCPMLVSTQLEDIVDFVDGTIGDGSSIEDGMMIALVGCFGAKCSPSLEYASDLAAELS